MNLTITIQGDGLAYEKTLAPGDATSANEARRVIDAILRTINKKPARNRKDAKA